MNMATGSCCSHRLQPSSDTFEMRRRRRGERRRRRRRRRRMGGENPSGNVWGDDTKKNGIIIKVTTWNGWKCFKSLKWAGIFPHLWFFFLLLLLFSFPQFSLNEINFIVFSFPPKKEKNLQFSFSFLFSFSILSCWKWFMWQRRSTHSKWTPKYLINEIEILSIFEIEKSNEFDFFGQLFMWQRRSTHSKWTPKYLVN